MNAYMADRFDPELEKFIEATESVSGGVVIGGNGGKFRTCSERHEESDHRSRRRVDTDKKRIPRVDLVSTLASSRAV